LLSPLVLFRACNSTSPAQPNLHWTLHPFEPSRTYGFNDVFYNGMSAAAPA
jgi:hypothetical protein